MRNGSLNLFGMVGREKPASRATGGGTNPSTTSSPTMVCPPLVLLLMQQLMAVRHETGESGIIGEHSCMDGTPTAALNDWLTNRLLGTGSVPPPPAPPSPAPAVPTLTPIELSFDIPDDVTQATAEAKQRHFVAVEENRLKHRVYSKYGKETIKGYKTSPDGWVQMVIQLAWALTMRGKGEIPCGTYESAQVRKFKLGRTEVVRTVSEARCVHSDRSDLTRTHLRLQRQMGRLHDGLIRTTFIAC